MSILSSVLCCLFELFFFFKQKSAYEMRISDWSSDVCSSDLNRLRSGELPLEALARTVPVDHVEAVLHPHDAVVVTAQLPPVPARLLESAVRGRDRKGVV